MASGARMYFSGDLFGNVAEMPAKHMAAITAAAKLTESQGIAHMRSNAPWTDRTGNARNGLNGQTDISGFKVLITFYHSVPYGIYLETRWSGRYQIILPTLEVMAPRFFNLCRAMIWKGSS